MVENPNTAVASLREAVVSPEPHMGAVWNRGSPALVLW